MPQKVAYYVHDFTQSAAVCWSKTCRYVMFRCRIVSLKSWTYVSHSVVSLATQTLCCLRRKLLDLRTLQWFVLVAFCLDVCRVYHPQS